MRRLRKLTACLLLAAPLSALASPDDAVSRCMDDAFDALPLDLDHAVSVSVAVLPIAGGDGWSRAVGRRRADQPSPVAVDDGYRVASNTKTYTAAAVLRLVEQGRLGLDDTLADRLPPVLLRPLQQAGYDLQAIRLRHLLTHTSGLREHVSDALFERQWQRPQRAWTPAEQIATAAAGGAPLAAPGEQFHYSDTGYVLLGQIVERVTGDPLPRALRELLQWQRHGLRHTWFEAQEPAAAAQVAQYWDGRTLADWHPSFDLFGGGGIIASPTDLARFLRALLRGELFDRADSLATMRTPGVADAWNGYGAGLFEIEVDGTRLIGHSGFWNTYAFHSPADGLIYAGASGEKTVMPYAERIAGLREIAARCGMR